MSQFAIVHTDIANIQTKKQKVYAGLVDNVDSLHRKIVAFCEIITLEECHVATEVVTNCCRACLLTNGHIFKKMSF